MRWVLPGLIALSASAVFAGITAAVLSGRTRSLDRRVNHWARTHRPVPINPLLRPLAWASGPAALVPATLAIASWVHRERGPRPALVLALSPFMAMSAGESCTRLLPRRRAPDASRLTRVEPCYPSGRTAGATAEALAIGYILAREGLASRSLMPKLGASAIIVGSSRVYRGRHWATDVIAAWISGIGLAAVDALIYELGAVSPRNRASRGGRPTPR